MADIKKMLKKDENIDFFDILEISKEAGRIAIREKSAGLSVTYKTDKKQDSVTQGDILVEKYLKDKLFMGGFDFYGEETGLSRKEGNIYRWIIDPIDGTAQYKNGIKEWCVSIGLLREGKAIFGLVHIPERFETFYAYRGHGAYHLSCDLNFETARFKVKEERIKVSKNSSLEGIILNTAYIDDIDNFRRVNSKLWNLSEKSFVMGALAYDWCKLAEGIYDVSVGFDCKNVDCCAAAVIIEEAGGRVSNFDGSPVDYNSPFVNCVASNSLVHNEVIKILNSQKDNINRGIR